MAKWIVDDNGNGDFSTISEAIAVVASRDKIVVTGGNDNIHRETNIIIDKELTITSDYDEVTIDGQEENRVFLIDDDDKNTQLVVKLSNLTITGGNANDLGGGILNRENLTLKNTSITGNTAQLRGGGIYNLDGELKINRSIISNNVSLVASGGGISNTGHLTVKNSIIENNSALAGAGIANAGEAEVIRSVISGNAAGSGAGIFNYGGQLNVKKSIISNNEAQVEGGGITNSNGAATVLKSIVTGNTATNDGGAIFVFRGELEVKKSLVDRNYSFYGGITSQFSDVTITKSKIVNNQGFIGAGVNSIADNTLLLNQNDIRSNTSIVGDSNAIQFSNFIEGTPEEDNLVGTSEMDILIGFEGDDVIFGQEGDDVIFGEGGSDIFVVTPDSGTDTILDFSEGEDAISLSEELRFDDLSFSGETIKLDGETLVVLLGIDTESLTSDSFKTIQV